MHCTLPGEQPSREYSSEFRAARLPDEQILAVLKRTALAGAQRLVYPLGRRIQTSSLQV